VSGDYYHIFLDEGGNLDFSLKGTKYFTLTAVTRVRTFDADNELNRLRFDFLEKGRDIEYFHAAEDKQAVRNEVFAIINKYIHNIQIDSLIVEKRKTGPALRADTRFYPEILGFLLKYVLNGLKPKPVIILTDALPLHRKKKTIRRVIQKHLNRILPNGIPYTTFHHSSKSCYGLQIADYCNWAIFRRWESGDERSYKLIRSAINSEFDIFQTGKIYYY